MTNFNEVTKENIKSHLPNWPPVPNHSYRMLITGGYGSGKTNTLFYLKCHQQDIDKFLL